MGIPTPRSLLVISLTVFGLLACNRDGNLRDPGLGGVGGIGAAGVGGGGAAGAGGVSTPRYGGRWGPAQEIDDGSAYAGISHVGIDRFGNAAAVWVGWSEETGVTLSANRWSEADGWGSVETTTASETHRLGGQMDASFDSSGNVTVALFTHDPALVRMMVSGTRWGPEEGWDAVDLLSPNHVYKVGSVMGADGSSVALWSEGGLHSRRGNAPQGGWGQTQLITSEVTYWFDAAIDASGNTIAVWRQDDQGGASIWASQAPPNGAWGPPERIDPLDTSSAARPSVAAAYGGKAVAVWEQSDGPRRDIWASHWTEEAGWGTPERIGTDVASEAIWAQVAMGAGGHAVVVWRQQVEGQRDNVWANRWTEESGWGLPELVGSSPSENAMWPQVAVDPSGNAVAVWRQGQSLFSGPASVWSNRSTPTGGWGTPERISPGSGDIWLASTAVAVDSTGSAFVVWAQSQDVGAVRRIWATRFTRIE